MEKWVASGSAVGNSCPHWAAGASGQGDVTGSAGHGNH